MYYSFWVASFLHATLVNAISIIRLSGLILNCIVSTLRMSFSVILCWTISAMSLQESKATFYVISNVIVL